MASFLNEFDSREILAAYDIPAGRYALAHSREEAGQLAEEAGYPVVMKIVSDQILHKTEAGGVTLNIKSRDEAELAYALLIERAKAYKPDAVIKGVLVSYMVPSGVEVIVGGLRDKQFGPVIMFGLGGIFVEIFKDVQFRMAPLTKKDALSLIRSIKAYPMLTGARGKTPVNQEALADLIVNLSRYLYENDDVTEIDLNPVNCFDGKVQILDAIIAKE